MEENATSIEKILQNQIKTTPKFFSRKKVYILLGLIISIILIILFLISYIKPKSNPIAQPQLKKIQNTPTPFENTTFINFGSDWKKTSENDNSQYYELKDKGLAVVILHQSAMQLPSLSNTQNMDVNSIEFQKEFLKKLKMKYIQYKNDYEPTSSVEDSDLFSFPSITVTMPIDPKDQSIMRKITFIKNGIFYEITFVSPENTFEDNWTDFSKLLVTTFSS